ncbi:MAG: GNAT family N-acetyltransferase [Nocardioides sp.]|nr:GNAT family N-acetyltransferase [Nocardioides sp.]
MTARVRDATPADAPGIAHVHVTTWQNAYRGVLPPTHLDTLSVPLRTEFWATFLADVPQRSRLHVAEDPAGEVLGFAGTCPTRDEDCDPDTTGEVAAIYVVDEHWGDGTGTALLVAATEGLVGDGFTEATLWVLADNPRAHRFYEREGWVLDGEQRHEVYADHRVVEVRYWRSLVDDG